MDPNESSPLLGPNDNGSQHDHAKPEYTPLPWSQLAISFYIRSTDAFMTESILPYIKQRVSELDVVGGDEGAVGYYVGLMGVLSYGVYGLTVLHWNRLSDSVGRKPIALIGLFGATIGMLSFGLSRTYWGLVASQCFWRLLDANMGIAKSIVGDITDSTNRAQGFGYAALTWQLSASISHPIGGLLAKPSERFPHVFGGTFWREHPYFLPCLVISTIVLGAFLTTLFSFKESAVHRSRPALETETSPISLRQPPTPPPLREVLIYPVLLSVVNYASYDLLYLCGNLIIPLFLGLPIELGGLGFVPSRIGYILGARRMLSALLLATVYIPVITRTGKRSLFVITACTFPILWSLFPLMNICARDFGISVGVWVGIAAMITLLAFTDTAFPTISAIVTESVPDSRNLGVTNGIVQMMVTMGRITAPALAPPLLSLSVQYNLLGGYAVYFVLFLLSWIVIWLAFQLPADQHPQRGKRK